jgi:hypothetical protein
MDGGEGNRTGNIGGGVDGDEGSIDDGEGNSDAGCNRVGRGNDGGGGCTGEVKEVAEQIARDVAVLADPDANGGVIGS